MDAVSRAGFAVRLAWLLAVLVFVILAALNVLDGHAFDATGYGTGFAAVFGAGGAGVWVHDRAAQS